ncbi:MAG: polysaccharide deacetylase family protein [Clostridia bacterium]|nr:polysaccharide deacetylase family protein [Clostridia bacterium]
MSLLVKIGKKGKKIVKKLITPAEKHYISYTRRLERIKTDRKICAMTFDDGPMDLPCAPDKNSGKSLTDTLLDTLGEYGAKGTFDVIGHTGENYPDVAGKPGSATWGGIKYDHYPDINKDDMGGAENCDRLIRRMLDEGHQITNHGYRHIIFGRKPFVYGKRAYIGDFEETISDLTKLHRLMEQRYDYKMTMSRPPHYVDKMDGGFTSYDVYTVMNYWYMAASFDGQGWLPSVLTDPEEALNAEVEAMICPIREALAKDKNFFCGQIIFQKDGYNMAKRTPVAYGLGEHLKLLRDAGYEIVTVEELTKESPFEDVGRDDPDFEKLCELSKTRAIVYDDNKLRLDAPMTYGELAMLLAPREAIVNIRNKMMKQSGKYIHPYATAMKWCKDKGVLDISVKLDRAVMSLPEKYFDKTADLTRRGVYRAYKMNN